MERLSVKYQPIINIQLKDEDFGESRLSIISQEQTKSIIERHSSKETMMPNKYSLAFLTQESTEHKSLQDILEIDYSLKEKAKQHSHVTYDYQKHNKEYTRQVLHPLAEEGTITQDLNDHIFENNLLLKFLVKVNPLYNDSLLPEDINESKLIFTDDILTPSTSVREKSIVITPILENGNQKWRIEEEGKAQQEVTSLNLENDVLIECHVNVPEHLSDVHSINYHIHIKRETINNP